MKRSAKIGKCSQCPFLELGGYAGRPKCAARSHLGRRIADHPLYLGRPRWCPLPITVEAAK